jgi:hypothetical protein
MINELKEEFLNVNKQLNELKENTNKLMSEIKKTIQDIK